MLQLLYVTLKVIAYKVHRSQSSHVHVNVDKTSPRYASRDEISNHIINITNIKRPRPTSERNTYHLAILHTVNRKKRRTSQVIQGFPSAPAERTLFFKPYEVLCEQCKSSLEKGREESSTHNRWRKICSITQLRTSFSLHKGYSLIKGLRSHRWTPFEDTHFYKASKVILPNPYAYRFLIPSFRILGDCKMRVRQLSKTSGTSSNNFIRSRMKTIFSEAICMIET